MQEWGLHIPSVRRGRDVTGAPLPTAHFPLRQNDKSELHDIDVAKTSPQAQMALVIPSNLYNSCIVDHLAVFGAFRHAH